MTAVIAVSQDDWYVEQGLTWRLEYSFDVPSGSHHYIGLTSGGSFVGVTSRSFSTEGTDTTYSLYSGTNYSGGSAITLRNRNDNYQTTTHKHPLTDCKGEVTASPVLGEYFGSIRLQTAKQLEASVGGDAGVLIMLKASTKYVLDIFNANGASRICKFSALLTRKDFIA